MTDSLATSFASDALAIESAVCSWARGCIQVYYSVIRFGNNFEAALCQWPELMSASIAGGSAFLVLVVSVPRP